MGGPSTPGVGVGIGIERIVLSLRAQDIEPSPLDSPQVMALHRGAAAKAVAVELVSQLRQARIPSLLAFGSRSLKAQFKSANRAAVRFAIILGEDELERGVATLRDMEDGEQTEVALGEVVAWLADRLISDL